MIKLEFDLRPVGKEATAVRKWAALAPAIAVVVNADDEAVLDFHGHQMEQESILAITG